jgi:hypothetical protein
MTQQEFERFLAEHGPRGRAFGVTFEDVALAEDLEHVSAVGASLSPSSPSRSPAR